jgi:hypothetical protein
VSTDADRIWNRACGVPIDPSLAPGDRHLASALLFHGYAMNGGVHHALEGLTESELEAAARGLAWLGFTEVAQALNT